MKVRLFLTVLAGLSFITYSRTGEPVELLTNLGIMSCSNWPDTNGFVDPITWIETQKSPSTVRPLDQHQ